MHEVIVVGGGPTGFVTALGLAKAGVRVCLVEAEAGINDSPRACVYHWSMLGGLERLGIREEAEQAGYTKDDYLWLVKRTGERLPYDLKVLSSVTRFPYNIQLGQDRLAQICHARLAALPNAEVHWDTPFTGLAQDADGVTVRADSPGGPIELRARWPPRTGTCCRGRVATSSTRPRRTRCTSAAPRLFAGAACCWRAMPRT